jgi:hypothetical protein
MFTASMDGNFNTDAVVLAPGALISVPSNMTTNPTLQQLSVVQQPDIEQYKAQELEMDIKKAMFDTTIPNDPSKMTATEINRRTGELAEQLNNSFGRLINEYMYPLVKRMIEILQNFGYLSDQINVVDFNGFGYKIKINTALARQQKTQDLNDILQYMSTALQIDPTQQLIAKVVDMDKLAIKMAELSGIPSDCIRTQDEIEMLRYQEQQSMRDQQVQAIDDNVAMSNAIEQGKANAKGSM